MLDELARVISAATGAEGGMAVVLVALVALGKQWIIGRQSADSVALTHLERSADKNMDELGKVRDRYMDVLERAAVLQGQLTALEREHSALKILFDAVEEREESTSDDRLDAIEEMLSEALTSDDDDDTTDKFERG